MIDEVLIESIVRNVIERLETRPASAPAGVSSDGARLPGCGASRTLDQLYQSYRTRYLAPAPPFEERFSVEFDSSEPIELGRPLFCIYEMHLPCDGCGRCQVRGF
jgi:hypothetical protein